MSKKAGTEARAAMSELVSELDRTRKEYAKTTLQLTQQETTVQHLKDAELKKDQVITHLESELERMEASHKQELAIAHEEYVTKDAAWAHRVKYLEVELQRLRSENEVYSQFEKENRQLRDAVMEHQSVIERLQRVNDDLRVKAKDDTKEYASQLEAEFRRRLADSEKRFRAEAYRALSEEAKIALQGNDHLQTVLQRQNDSIEAVLLRCKQLEQSHSKVKAEQEMSLQSLQQHMNEIQRLKKQLSDSKARNTQLEDALRQRKVERASLELLFIEYESTRKQLATAHDKAKRALREAERWRNRAVQLTHELGDGPERNAAEAKLDKMQKQSEDTEAHLRRRKARADKKQRDRQHNAEGAAAYRTAAGLEPPMEEGGEDWSEVSGSEEEDTRPSRAVNPMEILAMWNVNFENWRGTEQGHEQIEGHHYDAAPAVSHEAVEDPGVAPDFSVQPPQQRTQSDEGASPSKAEPLGMAHEQSGHAQLNLYHPGFGKATSEYVRANADKQMSVLSRRKVASLPPQARHVAGVANAKIAPGRRPPIQFSELSVVSSGGQFTRVGKKPTEADNRFVVP